MASFVLTDAYVAINSVDWSSKVREIKVNTSADVVENTAMGATWKARLPSLKDFSLDITFNQDHANSGLDDCVAPHTCGAWIETAWPPMATARHVVSPRIRAGLSLIHI